ncbi:MAG TPA: neutral/alkaline non-lysosomal ceramidase N-terminal domain-containing protein, partial [Methylomirabilota bacterium]|nr:neutral/alkaline non-lysosomal ceramidase N-terminal domain-containing protein [Methylomirabilota bacterium]
RQVEAMMRAAGVLAADEAQSIPDRSAAARLLARDPARRAEALALLRAWLEPARPGELQREAVAALALTGDAAVADVLLAAWPSLSPGTRALAAEALFSREPWTLAVLERGRIGDPLVLDATRKAQLLQHPSARVREAAGRLFNSGVASGRAGVIEAFRPALQLVGEAGRGEAIYARLCLACHQRNGLGVEIGPDLRSVASHPPDKLLVNILDPNADVQPGFHAYHGQLADGTELYGLIAAETGNSVTFKLTDGSTRVVAREDLARLEGARASLMPEGLEAGMSQQDMADLIAFLRTGAPRAQTAGDTVADLRVGAAAVNLRADDTMPLAGYLENRFTKEQEGELRAVAVVIEKPGSGKVAVVACDVLWVTRAMVDAAVAEIEQTTGIPASHVLVNATHTHHAPGTAPAHAFGWSEKFVEEVRRGIVESVRQANGRLAGATLFFNLGQEHSVGANSRLLLRDGNVSWLNPMAEAGELVQPTGAFDPELPVLDFRSPEGRTRALIFNHSTHTIGTRSGRDVRSPGFYGLAAQDLERELGGVVNFLEGASGSTHNIRGVPVPLAIERLKRVVLQSRSQATSRRVTRVAALKRPFTFRVRTFDEAEEAARVERYAQVYAKPAAGRIAEIFAAARRQLRPHQGEERTTWLQVLLIGDIALVGVPAEYFTALGLDIKRRSPFPDTYVAELANDWIGYLPDREGHRLGGYQTWTGLHSYAEPGTGERMADEAVKMLQELAAAR